MSEPTSLEEKVVFGVSTDQDNNLVITLGVPVQAWEYMKNGKTQTFDFTKIGLPIRLMMYGGPDNATVRAQIEEYNKKHGFVTKDMSDKDFGL